MNEPLPGAARQDAILEAAFAAFATYGFRRTTMDDIAQKAGMSRSALYLHYRNKEDIFRTMVAQFFQQAVADVAAALNQRGSPAEVLAAAFVAKDGSLMEVVLGTPHGSELLDAGFSTSGDLVAKGETEIVALLTGWLAKQTLPHGLGTASEVAQTMMAALKGLKSAAPDFDTYRAGELRLARMFGRAIDP
jgi:AcrR family transcriptional regulator